MGVIELDIYRTVNGVETLVAKANKWKFQDVVMGEQFITCTITSETPIDWEIGDHCTFRGQTYTLNYIPSVTQKAPIDSVLDALTYENVKLDSFQDELTRCMMLDVTPTTPEYQAVLGTNHTGSSRFQLYCGETTVNGSTLTAVCALALKMQANLDRLYPNAWHIHVDTTTAYVNVSGETVLVTHTDSKLLTFDNQTVAQALGLVHTEFKLDYCIKGRDIYIGYSIDSIDPINPIEDLTADDTEDRFVFGYGRGYADADNQGKSLFQIKQIANSQQKIVTRLRALGSTKNLPYNYYFKKYGLLSQALFPANLQLPGTFLPLGEPSDTADAEGGTKWSQNNARSQYLRKVLGDTNDSYIDKNDDAESCLEGIREDCARWDGSNGDLPEIYPTIEGVTFGELRDALVPDQTGATGDGAYQEGETKPNGDPVQPDYERIDCLLAVGYTDNGVLIDDANIGDGIMPENEVVDTGTHFAIGIGQTKLTYNPNSGHGDFEETGPFHFEGAEQTLFTVNDVKPGEYFMAPTGPSYSCVAFRFSVNGADSVDVGFVVRVWQKTDSGQSLIAEWSSSLLSVVGSSDEKELFLPEIPDQATTGQVSNLVVTAQSDVVVTIAPVISDVSANGQMALTYMVGRSQSGEYDPEYNWSAVQGDVASKYPFHVFIKDMGFDLTATFNGETPVMAMKSGMCVGRGFEIGENVQRATVNGIRGYLLTLNRVEDSNLHIYYPNEYYQLSAGDYFVLLNINMPDAYIRAAELRLLRAATEYLADNCETKYTYQPSIDDIYLQRNYDIMEAAGTREKSIFWRLYAGLKFRFNGIPSNAGDQLPLVSMTIEQVAITRGEGLTPKVELTLNDDVQQTTLQKLTVAVDRIYNGSIFGSGGVGTNMEAVVDICSRLFLSKTHDDTANGRIIFNDFVTFLSLMKAKGGINVGDFLSGFLGAGAHIGTDGRSEFEEVTVRGALRAAELIFNKISAEEGEAIRSIGHGEIETVDEENFTATLKLEGDEWATIDVDDICRGLYNTVNKEFDNATDEGEDGNGFRLKAGFFASYFRIEEVLTNSKGVCSFRYSLQPGTTEHPCPLMKFAVYGNFNRYNEASKKARQSSMYITAIGIAPRLLFLAGVDDWQIKPQNIKVALGNIEGVEVWENRDGNITLKTLHGDAGLFVEDNIYLGGIINQFTAADWQTIQDKLGQGISAQLLRGSDNIVVDALGNIVGGIYTEYGSGANIVRRYKLHTGVLVYDSGKGIYLTAQPDHTQPLGDNEYYIYHTCVGCEVLRDGSDYYVVGINNTFNGHTGSALTEDQLEVMRNTEECLVNFVIVTKNGWRTMMTYSVKITHLDTSYITFDLTNESDSFSFRTQNRQYAGLPITTKLKAYANGEELPDSAYLSSSVESDAFTGEITAATDEDAKQWVGNDAALYGLQCVISKAGLFTLRVNGRQRDIPDSKYYFDISCIVKYAGVSYMSPKKRFTVSEATDTTLYKLMLSASAVSKDGGTYTPSSINVNVQIWDNVGSKVGTPDPSTGQVYVDNVALENIYVRYLDTDYNPSWSAATLMNGWLDSMPDFRNVPTCMTVMVVDLENENNPSILDIETVPITAKGRDGAGQPWVDVYPETVVIDCDSDGNIATPVTINMSAKLYYGDTLQVLNPASCDMYLSDVSNDATPDSYDQNYTTAYKQFTFQGNGFKSKEIRVFLANNDENNPHTATKTVQVIANRKGTKGDTGRAGASLRFRGEWQDSVYYVWDSVFRDCVKHEGMYWFVNVDSDGTEPLGEPTAENENWMQVSNLQIVATELLLAENATIDMLYSNIIKMRDADGLLTATINEDQHGSYRIYYPSGNVMMEFSHEGYIYYFYDEIVNGQQVLSWKIGLGGDISKNNSDDWIPAALFKINDYPTGNPINASTRFERNVNCWRFVSAIGGQFSNYNGRYYAENTGHPTTDAYIDDGYYTPNIMPVQDVSSMGSTRFGITLYHIVDGEIESATTIFDTY